MGHARSICIVFIPFSLSLALLLSEPDLLCIHICYIYAGCKVTENIREWSDYLTNYISEFSLRFT